MKYNQILFLRILLILTFFVGLLGTAQYFLVYKNRIADAPLTNTKSVINTTVARSYSTKPLFHRVPPSSEIIEKPFAKSKLSFQDHLAIQAELRLQSDVTYH